MNDRLIALLDERNALIKRIMWLGLRSTGSERHEARIAAIDAELSRYENKSSNSLVETLNASNG